jgi:hypothetical protein
VTDVDVTELAVLDASEGVHGVGKAANGTPFLLVKAAADDGKETCSTCKGTGKIMEGNRECPDCKGSGEVAAKSDSSEADEIEDELTDGAAKELAGRFCGDLQCATCGAAKAKLSAADRKALPASSFAFVDKNGGKHLPVHDPGHTKAALGRFGQQDFSEAKGDPADAKKKAAGKILAAAKKHGIEVDGGSEVAEAAKKGAVQDALNGTQEPREAGHLDSGNSGTSGSVTAGVVDPPTDSSMQLGGKTTSVIPDERKVNTGHPIPTTTDPAGAINPQALKGIIAGSLMEAIDQLAEQRQAIKDGKFVMAAGDAALSPGSMPWESYDAATLKQVAEMLAGCCNALDMMASREREESLVADPGDIENAWDLEEAQSALDYAMGVVARLSFSEAAQSEAAKNTSVVKVGRTLSGKNTDALRAARDHLNAVIDGAETKAGDAGTSEEDKIVTEVTKSELADAITTGVVAGLKAERKAAKKARKEAKKNANNGGDVTAADLHPTAEVDADNINGIPDGGSVDGQYVNKGTDEPDPAVKAVADQIEGLAGTLASVQETVAKIAARPRPGGPSLDGQNRGTPAVEGRTEQVTKGIDDTALESLEKSYQAATDPLEKDRLGEQLTSERLYRAHLQEFPALR